MKTDKELLMLAAKAVGLDLTGWNWVDTPFYTGFQRRNSEESGWELQTSEWNPLDDSNDVLRLAVDLDIDVMPRWGDGESAALGKHGDFFYEPHNNDKRAATCRAVVRSAAAIGEQMP